MRLHVMHAHVRLQRGELQDEDPRVPLRNSMFPCATLIHTLMSNTRSLFLSHSAKMALISASCSAEGSNVTSWGTPGSGTAHLQAQRVQRRGCVWTV